MGPARGTLAARLAAGALVATVLLAVAGSFVAFFQWNSLRVDAAAYWDAAVHLRRAEPLYSSEPVPALAKAYLYPPAFAALFAPLTLLPPVWGYASWMTILWAALAALAVAALRLAAGDPLPPPASWLGCDVAPEPLVAAALAAAVLLPAIVANFQEGQVNIVVAALVAGALLSAGRGRPLAGGALLALAAHIKVIPAILVAAFALWRAGRVLRGFALGAVAFVGLPLLVLLPALGPLRAVGETLALQAQFAGRILLPAARTARVAGVEQYHDPNASLAGVMMRLFGDEVALSAFPADAARQGPLLVALPRPVISAAALALGAGLLAGGLHACRRAARTERARTSAAALLLVAASLAGATLWPHHLIVVSLLLAGVWRILAGEPARLRSFALSCLPLLLLFTLPFLIQTGASLCGRETPGAIRAASEHGLPTIALLVTWGYVYALILRRTAAGFETGAPSPG